MITLEGEFERAKAEHKHNVLKVLIIDYLYTLYKSGKLTIPEFADADKYISILAERNIKDIVMLGDNMQRFNELYDMAYKVLSPLLDKLNRRLYVK
jgi:ArsR family metal-binding transcriptional regulator